MARRNIILYTWTALLIVLGAVITSSTHAQNFPVLDGVLCTLRLLVSGGFVGAAEAEGVRLKL